MRDKKGTVRPARSAIFPLDEELQLLPGKYTPHIQESLTRLGCKLPFMQAAEEVGFIQRTEVKEANLREITYRYGELVEEMVEEEAKTLLEQMPSTEAVDETLLVSEDGSLIHLKSGEWYEVKMVAVGEVESEWNQKTNQVEVHTKNLSYFASGHRIREFEKKALPELYRRGALSGAPIVTVNDGASWITSFTEYHFPEATRILDFHHATGYLADAGKAIYGEGSEEFKDWFTERRHQLKHKPPEQILGELALLRTKADTEEKKDVIDTAHYYLEQRKEMIDYPYFQTRQLPIGSGSVESSHKQVVQSRMKQAGMRWAKPNIEPLLMLRNLVCNGRWEEGWSKVAPHYWEKRRTQFQEKARKQRPQVPAISLEDVKVAPDVRVATSDCQTAISPSQSDQSDHPWRNNKWPSYETRWLQ